MNVLQRSLESLSTEIANARSALFPDTDTKHGEDKNTTNPTPIPTSPHVIPHHALPAKSRMGNLKTALKSTLRFPIRRPNDNYAQIPGTVSTGNLTRAVPDDHSNGLINTPIGLNNIPAERTEQKYTPGRLLSILAPIVSALQRYGLSPYLHAHGAVPLELRLQFINLCEQVGALLTDIQSPLDAGASLVGHEAGTVKANSDTDTDAEMSLLLLSALLQKVQAEKNKHQSPLTSILSAHHDIAMDHTQFKTTPPDNQSYRSSSPLIIHRACPSLSSRRSSQTSAGARSIIKTPVPASLERGEYTNFMGQSQATWRLNVHRIASFQSSALFSDSPVAILKPISIASISQMP